MVGMQPEPTAGVVPVHHKIADDLRGRILSGLLKPGDPVPSVAELCKQWGCAPGSARSALAVLTGEGRITGGRGKRARVRAPARRVRISIDASQEQKNLVLRPRHERAVRGAIEITAGIPIDQVNSFHRYSIVEASGDLVSEFDVEPSAKFLRRVYEMTDPGSDTRIAWSVSYIPLALIESNPMLLDENNEPWPGGHMHQLYTVGIEIDRMVRSVTAIEPTPGDRQRWGMEQGVPLLVVRTRSIDTNNVTVEMSEATYPADRADLVFTEKLRRWPKGHAIYRAESEK